MLKIAQGAEAVVYKDNNQIIKERLSKKYRIAELDNSLRKFRTKREAKILGKLEELNFPAPHLRHFSEERMALIMDFIPGEKVKDFLSMEKEYPKMGQEIGQRLARLHQQHIIHGDATTSNLIKNSTTGEISFIDFGLSFFSEKAEDKAVDLYLLDKSLKSTHFPIYPQIFKHVLEGYKRNNPEAEEILQRLQKVIQRGRNKNKLM